MTSAGTALVVACVSCGWPMGTRLAFEIDHAEPHSKRGWSVVARGTARTVTYDDVARLGRNLPRPIVMKPGMRVFTIRPDDIIGRSIQPGPRCGR